VAVAVAVQMLRRLRMVIADDFRDFLRCVFSNHLLGHGKLLPLERNQLGGAAALLGARPGLMTF